MIAKLNKTSVILSLFFSLLSCEKNHSFIEKCPEKTTKIEPRTYQPIMDKSIEDAPSLIMLKQFAIGLEKFKQKYNYYPISGNSGKDWDKPRMDSITKEIIWINGLTPEFIEKYSDLLTTLENKDAYIYKSNGAHYKLVVINPSDCLTVIKYFPHFFEYSVGKTCNYGIWTFKARHWQ